MAADTVELFYAILAVLAAMFVVAMVVLRLLAFVSVSANDWYREIAAVIEPNAVGMAFIVAALATAGSLYFSEIAHFEPCKLCWFQRIAMYPLVVLLGIAAVRRDPGIGIYVKALALIGALISTYHVALEWVPSLDTGACGLGPACTVIWFRALGFISLPTLALTAFVLIITLLSLHGPAEPDDEEDGPDPTLDRSAA